MKSVKNNRIICGWKYLLYRVLTLSISSNTASFGVLHFLPPKPSRYDVHTERSLALLGIMTPLQFSTVIWLLRHNSSALGMPRLPLITLIPHRHRVNSDTCTTGTYLKHCRGAVQGRFQRCMHAAYCIFANHFPIIRHLRSSAVMPMWALWHSPLFESPIWPRGRAKAVSADEATDQ